MRTIASAKIGITSNSTIKSLRIFSVLMVLIRRPYLLVLYLQTFISNLQGKTNDEKRGKTDRFTLCSSKEG